MGVTLLFFACNLAPLYDLKDYGDNRDEEGAETSSLAQKQQAVLRGRIKSAPYPRHFFFHANNQNRSTIPAADREFRYFHSPVLFVMPLAEEDETARRRTGTRAEHAGLFVFLRDGATFDLRITTISHSTVTRPDYPLGPGLLISFE